MKSNVKNIIGLGLVVAAFLWLLFISKTSDNEYRIKKETDYIRICVYPTFIHGDYKDTHQGKRLLFEYKVDKDGDWDWDFIKFINNEK